MTNQAINPVCDKFHYAHILFSDEIPFAEIQLFYALIWLILQQPNLLLYDQ